VVYTRIRFESHGFTALDDVAEAAAVILIEDRKNTVERAIGLQRRYLLRAGWLNMQLRLPVASSQQQFVIPKVFKATRRSLVQHSNQHMQKEDSDFLNRSKTEESRTLEA